MTFLRTTPRAEEGDKVGLTISHAGGLSRAWLTVAFLFTFMVINYADRTALGLAAGAITKQFNLTPSQFGAIGSSFFLFYTLSALCVGFIINRVGAKKMMFGLVAVWTLAQLPLLAFSNFATLLGTRMLLGAGEGPGSPAAMHTIFKWFPNERRTLPASLISQGSAVGGVVAAPVLSWMILTYGWQSAFGALGVVGAIWAICWLFVGRDGPIVENTTMAGSRLLKVPYRRLLLNPTIWATWFVLFACNWAITMVVIWFPSYLRVGLGVADTSVGLYSALPWAGGAVVVLGFGWLSQKLLLSGKSSREARVVYICLAGCVGALCLFLLPLMPSVGLKIALVTLGVVLPNAFVAPAQAIQAEVSPVGQRGAVLAIGNAVWGSSGFVVPVLAGLLIQNAKLPIQGYEAAFGLCGAVVLVANLVGLIFIRPSGQAEKFALEQPVQSPA